MPRPPPYRAGPAPAGQLFSFVLTIFSCAFTGCEKKQEETVVLNVFNWGEYISDGEGFWEYEDEEGNVIEVPYLDLNKEFEEYYKNC